MSRENMGPSDIRLRYSMRILWRKPGFGLIVVVVLALAIGGATLISTVIDEVLFSALPYRDPSRLVMIWESNPGQPEPAGSHIPAARQNFDVWRRNNESFESVEAYRQTSFNLTGLRFPEHVEVAGATAGFFHLLGVAPAMGRSFSVEDESRHNPVALLSHNFYWTHFQGSSPVGRTLLLDGSPYTVIGVLPGSFHLPNIVQGLFEFKPDLWVPLAPVASGDSVMASKYRNLIVYARLKQDVTRSQAELQMKNLAAQLAKENPSLDSGYTANVYRLDFENTDPELRRALYILWAAVGAVQILAWVNLAGLMFLRYSAQQKDVAVMRALGARKWQLVSTLVPHGLILALIGAAFGGLVSYIGIRLIALLKPNEIHSIERISLNTHFTRALKQTGTARITGKPHSFTRGLLVSIEVALAVSLAIGSTLLVRSFERLLRVNPGFGAHNVLTAHLSLPRSRYTSDGDRLRFSNRLNQDLKALPQVESVSMIDNMPLYAIRYAPFEVEGRPVSRIGDAPSADYANTTPNFFNSMGVTLKKGRFFVAADAEENAAKVVIMNETLARTLWPGQDPIGKHIRSLDGGQGPWATVVGVVADFVQFNVAVPPRPELFWPARSFSEMTVVLRTVGQPAGVSPFLQKALWQIDKDQPVSDVQTLEEILKDSISQARFNMAALSIFASVGIVLAVVGVYGLISYIVSSRSRDIGIRFALGARRNHIVMSLLWQTVPPVLAGTVIGIALAFLLGKVISTLLFAVKPLDLMTYVIAPLVVCGLMLLVIVLPATKAARTAPAAVLRQE
jgi:putative ABC transport system permease protein